MTMGMLLGVVTAAMLIAFAGVAVWAWLPARRADFDQAATLPLRDEDEGAQR